MLGLQFLNPNVAGEMAQLLIRNQEKYVPTVGSGETRKLLDSIFFDGDQLTEERARNSQLIFKDGDNDVDRLEGLQPVHADWHAKVNLYQVMSIKTPPDPSLLSTCCFLFGSQHQNMELRNRLAVDVFILPLFN